VQAALRYPCSQLYVQRVTGLAADPSGIALAVRDAASEAIHVLPWPLPGMPPLQQRMEQGPCCMPGSVRPLLRGIESGLGCDWGA
jgi:hypothetical protein